MDDGCQMKGKLEDEIDLNKDMDSVTGLLKNYSYYIKVKRTLKENKDKKYCMIAVDIEHFKMFNKWYGKEAGDNFLASIAQKLKEAEVKYNAVAGYFGEDNFAVLLPNKEDYLKNFQEEILSYSKKNNNGLGFLPAFGIYEIKDNDMDVLDMYDRAVIAVSHVKGNYAVNSCKFNEEMFQRIESE